MMRHERLSSELLQYLVACGEDHDETLPALPELGRQLGVSVSKLREQLEAAKTLGLVDVRPHIGIRRLPYAFLPAVRQSLLYAVALDWSNFEAFYDLRNRVEAAYWYEAVQLLKPDDHERLDEFIDQAWQKLRGYPIQIPHVEHRELHLTIYQHLKNPFVRGILEGYWDAYEVVGLNVYSDIDYLEQVWEFHAQMVAAIKAGAFESGYEALVKHKGLLYKRPQRVAEPAAGAEKLNDIIGEGALELGGTSPGEHGVGLGK